MRTRSCLSNVLWATLCGLALGPALGLVAVSFTDRQFFELWPDHWTLHWYRDAASGPWGSVIVRSFLVAALGSAIGVLMTLPGAYVAAVEPAKGRTLLLHVCALTPALVPAITLATGYYRIVGDLRLLALVVPYASLVGPLAYLVQLYGFVRLGEDTRMVARLGGASEFQVLVHVFITGAAPQIALAWLLGTVFLLDEGVVSLLITEPLTRPFSKLVFETMTRERDLAAVAANVMLVALAVMFFAFVLRPQLREMERR